MIDITSGVDVNTLKQKDFSNVNTKNIEDEKLKAVCDDFEAFFLKQMMDVGLKSTKIAGEEAGADIIKSMYTDTLSTKSAGGMGISSLLFEHLSKNNK